MMALYILIFDKYFFYWKDIKKYEIMTNVFNIIINSFVHFDILSKFDWSNKYLIFWLYGKFDDSLYWKL